MRNYDDIAARLRNKVLEALAGGGIEEMPGDDDSLVDSGLIDSLAVVDLAVFMEAEFGLDFSLVYFDVNNFDSIASMARFVELSLSGK